MLRRVLALVVTVLLLTGFTGCMKLKHRTTVMPDGSGKFVMTFALGKEMSDAMKAIADAARDADPGAAAPPDFLVGRLADLANGYEGVVAFTKPERFEKDGFSYAVTTAYFEDISKVRVFKRWEVDAAGNVAKPSTSAGSLSFKFTRTTDGFTLVADNQMFGDKEKSAADPFRSTKSSDATERLKTELRKLLAGFEVSETYVLPGTVTAADVPLLKTGRTASFGVTIEDLLADTDRYRKELPYGVRKISCGKSLVTDADLKAFHAEIDAAKLAWAKLLADEAAGEGASPAPANGARRAPRRGSETDDGGSKLPPEYR